MEPSDLTLVEFVQAKNAKLKRTYGSLALDHTAVKELIANGLYCRLRNTSPHGT